jgi:hypothetical protein
VLLVPRQCDGNQRKNGRRALETLHGANRLHRRIGLGQLVIPDLLRQVVYITTGNVYWGSGYTNLGIPGFTGNNKFFAFGLNGR